MNRDRVQETKSPCPVCKKPAAWKENPSRPFCSERCRLIDLGAWASEEYRIAGEDRTTSDGQGQGKKDTVE